MTALVISGIRAMKEDKKQHSHEARNDQVNALYLLRLLFFVDDISTKDSQGPQTCHGVLVLRITCVRCMPFFESEWWSSNLEQRTPSNCPCK